MNIPKGRKYITDNQLLKKLPLGVNGNNDTNPHVIKQI